MNARNFWFVLVLTGCGNAPESMQGGDDPPDQGTCGANASPNGLNGCVCNVGFVADVSPEKGCRQSLCDISDVGEWKPLPPLAEGRYSNCTVYVPETSTVYAIGGSSSDHLIKTVEAFDLSAGTWRFVAPLPRDGIDGAGCVVFDGRVILTNGRDGNSIDKEHVTNQVRFYDQANDRWSFGPDTLEERAWAGVAVFNNEIVVAGGRSNWFVVNGANELYQDTVEVFDGVSWRPDEKLPKRMDGNALVAHHGQLLSLGGRWWIDGSVPPTRYDFIISRSANSTWEDVGNLPMPTAGLSAATDRQGNGWLVIGGELFRMTEAPDWLEWVTTVPRNTEASLPCDVTRFSKGLIALPEGIMWVSGGCAYDKPATKTAHLYCLL